ncbi:hypothetical protein RBWH47_01578 [Rhodopirellula baltica WH47]|uniref:Uncharacterized protein n=2 Tax=Rhodopirellula baltica TaxID=265606 RepID=F2AKQ2_RHOBT|nr:hypothetical protein RBWH47_01578 [Rhodopirellula baltica WH47]
MTEIQKQRLEERERLRTSKFDVVTSLFMSLILFIGAFVLMLFIVWLTMRMPERVKSFPPIEENAAGRADNAEGFERDFEPPGAEEVEELMEPTLQDTIEAVTDAVSSVAGALDTMNTSATASTAGTGKGDSRPPGPEGEGEDIIPRFERWQLNFSAKGLKPYASQLDYYKIELGAIGGSVQGVDYASNLASKPKSRHVDDSESEKRLYFMWTTPSPPDAVRPNFADSGRNQRHRSANAEVHPARTRKRTGPHRARIRQRKRTSKRRFDRQNDLPKHRERKRVPIRSRGSAISQRQMT